MNDHSNIETLLHQVKVRKYKEGSPKKILMDILDTIEMKSHHGHMRNWEMLVELLAIWLKLNADWPRAGPLRDFPDLDTEKHGGLFKHINEKDLFRYYVTAARANPWDHLGELYTDLELVGQGQNMTPKGVVDMMIEMTYGEAPKTLKTQLDPCVGTGRFLIGTTLIFPKAPLVLFGVEINPGLYRACLVNMKLFSNHPYSIICADSLRLETAGPSSPVWDYGNRWNPPDLSKFYWKPPPIRRDAFSLKAFTQMKT